MNEAKPAPPATSSGDPRPAVRVLSWNIRAGGGRRAEGIAAQLEAWRPDIVAFSEYRATPPSLWLASFLATAGLRHQRSTLDLRDPLALSSNRLLVASRWPLRITAARSSSVRLAPEAARWLLLRVASERPFALGAMHVPNRVTGRKWPFHDAVIALARGWRGGPALLVGDTNSGRIGVDEESPAFNAREDRWLTELEAAGWRDAYRHRFPDERTFSWYSPNRGNGFRLDQAFVHRRLLPRLLDVRYEWGALEGSPRRDALSDHAALIVDLEP